MPKYLKDFVRDAGGTLLLQVESIGAPFTNQRGKDVRHVVFKIKSTGQVLPEDVLDVKFKYDLKGVIAGNCVEAFIGPKGHVYFKKINSTAESSDPFSQTPFEQVQAERKASESLVKEEAKWDKIALSKIVHEFMKPGVSLGKSAKEMAAIAKDYAREQEKAVEELWIERTSA